MSEKYYVVSEEELEDFKYAVSASAYASIGAFEAASKALQNCYDTCRARPVRFIGAHGEGSSLMLWGEE